MSNICADDVKLEIKRSSCGSFFNVLLHIGPAVFEFGLLNNKEMDELCDKLRGLSEQLRG